MGLCNNEKESLINMNLESDTLYVKHLQQEFSMNYLGNHIHVAISPRISQIREMY